MRLLLATIVIFSASEARGSPACGSFASLGDEMTRCEDNAELGEAALTCVKSYRARIQKAQAEVLNKFQAQIEAMKREQSDSFDRTQAGYEEARRTLHSLIEQGKQARASVDDLEANLYLPADFDDPAHTRMSTEEYLATEECYATPKKVLGQSRRMIDKMTNDLVQLEQLALAKQDRSGTRSVNVQAIDPPKKVTGGVGVGSGKAVPGRNPANSSSDISGTKKAIDDARKGGATASQPKK